MVIHHRHNLTRCPFIISNIAKIVNAVHAMSRGTRFCQVTFKDCHELRFSIVRHVDIFTFSHHNGEDVAGSTDDDNDLSQLTKFNQLTIQIHFSSINLIKIKSFHFISL